MIILKGILKLKVLSYNKLYTLIQKEGELLKSAILKDIFKCTKIALFISLGIAIFFTLIYYIFYSNNDISLLNFIKNNLYYVGCFGFLISSGFFIQKNATRPLTYQDSWNKMFSKLNLGFVVMFVSLFICFYGMIIQLSLETRII